MIIKNANSSVIFACNDVFNVTLTESYGGRYYIEITVPNMTTQRIGRYPNFEKASNDMEKFWRAIQNKETSFIFDTDIDIE